MLRNPAVEDESKVDFSKPMTNPIEIPLNGFQNQYIAFSCNLALPLVSALKYEW